MKYAVPVFCLFFSLILVANNYIDNKNLQHPENSHFYIPNPEKAKLLSLGHSVGISSLFWSYSLVKQGEAYLTGSRYPFLALSVNLVTSLDSLFHTPYLILSALYPTYSPDTSDFVSFNRALIAFPRDWKIALAFALRLNRLGMHQRASTIMESFSKDLNAPDYIRRIYRTFMAKGQPTKAALSIYLNDYFNPQFNSFKKGLVTKILNLFYDNKSIQDQLSNLLNQYESEQINQEEFYIFLKGILAEYDSDKKH